MHMYNKMRFAFSINNAYLKVMLTAIYQLFILQKLNLKSTCPYFTKDMIAMIIINH